MCNRLHGDSTPINEEGIGYKIFFKVGSNLSRMVIPLSESPYPKNRWVRWNGRFGGKEFGFCFFLSLKEAKKCLRAWCKEYPDDLPPSYHMTDYSIHEIKYKKGLGSHREWGIITNIGFKVSICKEFKIGEQIL